MANYRRERLDLEGRVSSAPSIGTKVMVSVAAVLVIVLMLSAALFTLYEKRFFEHNINARAERMLTSLEAVHVPAMLHRFDTSDGDPVIDALNDTFGRLSQSSDDAEVWLVMGPEVLEFQIAKGAAEIERPRDTVDEEAIRSGAPVSRIVDGASLRLTRPVILGEGAAAHERCLACHGGIMGLAAGDVIGAYAVDLSIGADRDKYVTSTRGALAIALLASIGVSLMTAAWLKRAVGDPLSDMSSVMDRLAGGDLDVSVRGVGRGDEIGHMARAVEVFKAKAIEARELERRFTDAQRRSTMGEMASGLAHELAQPLASIDSYCTGALRRLRGESWNRDELIGVMQKASAMTHRASAIIRTIAAQVGGRQPERVAISINEIVRAVQPLLETDAERHDVRHNVRLGASLPKSLVEEVGIGSVILNIAHNSIEAMQANDPASRCLTIETRRADNDRIELSVTDTGPGLAEGAMTRLFDPFFTTKPTGMGMGLAICRSIVEAHGGRIWAAQPEGGGTAIHFTLSTLDPAECADDA